MRLLYWAPRAIGIAFAVFLGVFAVDEWSRPADLWLRALGFSIHLIPAAMVLFGLLMAWNREWVGAVLFPFLALIYLVATRGQLDRTVYVVIGGPLLVVGILFGLNWRRQRP